MDEAALPSSAGVTPGFSRTSTGESFFSPVTVDTTFTAPDTFEPLTTTVFLVNASVRVGSELAATDDAVISTSPDATAATLSAAATSTDRFMGASSIRGENGDVVNAERPPSNAPQRHAAIHLTRETSGAAFRKRYRLAAHPRPNPSDHHPMKPLCCFGTNAAPRSGPGSLPLPREPSTPRWGIVGSCVDRQPALWIRLLSLSRSSSAIVGWRDCRKPGGVGGD